MMKNFSYEEILPRLELFSQKQNWPRETIEVHFKDRINKNINNKVINYGRFKGNSSHPEQCLELADWKIG